MSLATLAEPATEVRRRVRTLPIPPGLEYGSVTVYADEACTKIIRVISAEAVQVLARAKWKDARSITPAHAKPTGRHSRIPPPTWSKTRTLVSQVPARKLRDGQRDWT